MKPKSRHVYSYVCISYCNGYIRMTSFTIIHLSIK